MKVFFVRRHAQIDHGYGAAIRKQPCKATFTFTKSIKPPVNRACVLSETMIICISGPSWESRFGNYCNAFKWWVLLKPKTKKNCPLWLKNKDSFTALRKWVVLQLNLKLDGYLLEYLSSSYPQIDWFYHYKQLSFYSVRTLAFLSGHSHHHMKQLELIHGSQISRGRRDLQNKNKEPALYIYFFFIKLKEKKWGIIFCFVLHANRGSEPVYKIQTVKQIRSIEFIWVFPKWRKKNPVAKCYLQWKLNPSTSDVRVLHATVWANIAHCWKKIHFCNQWIYCKLAIVVKK